MIKIEIEKKIKLKNEKNKDVIDDTDRFLNKFTSKKNRNQDKKRSYSPVNKDVKLNDKSYSSREDKYDRRKNRSYKRKSPPRSSGRSYRRRSYSRD